MKQKGRAVTGIGLLLLAAACAKGRPGALPSCPSNVGFARLVDDYFDARFAFAPTSATSVGLHDRDAQLEDRSAARIRERIAELKRFRARFGEIDRGRLSFDDAIDAEALANQVEAELLDLEILAVWEKNPMGYAGLPGEAIDALMQPRRERRGCAC